MPLALPGTTGCYRAMRCQQPCNKKTAGSVPMDRTGCLSFKRLVAQRLLAEQSQHVLRVLVRNLEHGRAGLHQDLSPGQSGRFRSEVSVADRALGLGQVHQGVVERVLVRLKRRALESTQPTAERGDLCA